MKLEIDYEWVEAPPGMRSSSDRETLAELKLAVGHRVLTSNRSIAADAVFEDDRDFVRVSLFPLAEFIASNWWALLYETSKAPLDAREYSARHILSRNRDGFAYPHIALFGADSRVQISAASCEIPSAGIEFPTELGKEETTLERAATERTLLTLLSDVFQRLTNHDDRRSLGESLEAIEASRADPDETEFCVLAGLLGADPYDPSDRLDQTIRAVRAMLGATLSREIFATSELGSALDRSKEISRFAEHGLKKNKAAAEHVAGIKASFRQRLANTPSYTQKPWTMGYLAANELRRVLSLDGGEPLPEEETLRRKLFDGAPVSQFSDWSRLGANGVGAEDSKGFGIAVDRRDGRNPRFQVTATFADYLFADETDIFLLTRASTDRQKRNKAFAAEFLVPIESIRAKLRNRNVATYDDQGKICSEFGVSRPIVRYQIQNQLPDVVVEA